MEKLELQGEKKKLKDIAGGKDHDKYEQSRD